jgi:hypothetical protein
MPRLPLPRAILLPILAAALIAGCESIDDGSAPSPGPGSGPIFTPGPSNPSGPSGPSAPSDPRPINPPGRIPQTAELAAIGFGRLTYEAPRSGTIWVANTTRNYEIISQRVKRGDTLEVIPQRDRIELDDKPLSTSNLESNDEHAIFFRPTNWSTGPKPYGDIPRTSDNVATGFGEIAWHAEAAGTIWIGDDRSKRMILSSPVKADDLIEIDASEDRIKLNGRVIYRQNLESKHSHSIFFAR